MVNPTLARLAGRPLALAPRALDGLLAIRASPDAMSVRPLPGDGGTPPRPYIMTDGGIAVVPVLGPLVTRGDWLSALFGATSYGEVADAVEAAFADPSARAVLLELDSPGGEVGGLFDLVDRVAALRDAAQKPLWAVASECALSAGYAIASVADRLYVTRTAEIGSVGIVAIHVDESAADTMAGLEWTLVHAGARKVDGNAHEPLSEPALSAIQADVDALHAELVALVAQNRGMAPAVVRATEAAIFRGQRGIDVGFADRLGTVDRALAELVAELDMPSVPVAPRPARAHQPARSKPEMTVETPVIAPAPEAGTETPEPAPPKTPPAPAPAAVAPAAPAPAAPASAAPVPAAPDPAERLRAEYAEIAAIAAQAGRLGVAIDAADAMAKGIRPEAMRRTVLDTLAARSEASVVVAAAPQAPGGDSPIVRRARERAAAAHS